MRIYFIDEYYNRNNLYEFHFQTVYVPHRPIAGGTPEERTALI